MVTEHSVEAPAGKREPLRITLDQPHADGSRSPPRMGQLAFGKIDADSLRPLLEERQSPLRGTATKL